MSYIQNLFTSRDNNANGASYVGQQDRLWWNPDTNAFYYSDGNTAGGIPVGTSSGNGLPHGPANSVQLNAGNGTFLGSGNLTFANNVLTVNGNVVANYFIGDGSQITNVPGVSLGNLYVIDQTIYGNNINGNISLSPEGSGWVDVPKLAIATSNISIQGGKLQFNTPAGVDIQFAPGSLGNILTAGTIKPTSNNIAGLGAVGSRYTDLWLGAGNINLIDQGIGDNQEIYVNNGNVILGDSAGLWTGNWRIYDDTIQLANVSANMVIGNASANGWVQFNRSIAVQTQVGATAFSVGKDGLTNIYTPGAISNTQSALNIVGSSSGNSQPRSPTFTGTMLQITGQDNLPARVSIDAFGATGAQNSYALIASRVARGTVDTPAPLQANDLMMRFTNQGWTGNGYAPSIARFNFAAAEAFTSNVAVGTYANIQLTPIGSNVIKTVTGFSGNGIVIPSSGAGGTGNLGITFQDGSYQNTAYSPDNSVSSLVAGAGINLSGSTGDITVTNTGILGIIGTPNRVTVASNVAGVVTLTTPQDLNTTANMTLYSLTVTNLSITGNVSNVIPSTVDGPVVYVANTATAYNDINNSGLITGNIANNYSAGILYKTAGNTWNFDYGNSLGITANTIYGNSAFLNNFAHVGYSNATVDYDNATIQADSNVDNFSQIVQQNHFQGASASSDFVAVANNGDESNFYIDMGINSNVYNNNDYFVTKANDGYLYVNGGNLVIGTQTAAKVINLITGGTSNAENFVRGTVSDTGLSMVGNVTANNFAGNTLAATTISGTTVSATSVTGTVVSVTGSITGPSIFGTTISATANVVAGNVRTAGQISATGNITGGNLVTATTVVNSGVSTSGNITGVNVIASGTVSALGNIVTPNLNASIAIVSTLLSITGNITGGNLITDGLISTTGNATFGNVQTVGRISVTGNIDSGNLRTSGLVLATTVSATGNITGGNISATNHTGTTVNVTGNITGGNIITGGLISATGNITGGNVLATGLSGTLLTASQPNITSVGTLGSLSVTANVTGGNVLTGGLISATGNVTGGNVLIGATTYANNSITTTATAADFTIGLVGSTGNLILNRNTNFAKDARVTGNVSAGNVAVALGGTITTPRIVLNDGGVRQLTGNTAVTLDFSVDSMVSLTNPTGAVTVTLANYTAGAIVRFIYSSATARNIAMGVAAGVNSTTGGTTITGTGGGAMYGANQSVVLTYYCVGGTAATTYVAVSYT